jgi:uncharacterized protein YidB (DUF937 family)
MSRGFPSMTALLGLLEDTLSKQTGLSRDELVTRLCRELPDAEDKYTPQGHLPTEAEFSRP